MWTINNNILGFLFKTDFKFIGKVESQTNNFYKISVVAHFKFFLPPKLIGSLIYMPNYSGKNLEPLLMV